MRRTVAMTGTAVAVAAFLIFVPVVPLTAPYACNPPLGARCPTYTYRESVSLYYLQLGAIYGYCTGSDLHVVVLTTVGLCDHFFT